MMIRAGSVLENGLCAAVGMHFYSGRMCNTSWDPAAVTGASVGVRKSAA